MKKLIYIFIIAIVFLGCSSDNEELKCPDTVYKITVIEPQKGRLSASAEYALEGARIILTVTPPEDENINEISAVMSGGVRVNVSGTGNARFFTMPAGNVTVSVVWSGPVSAQYNVIVEPAAGGNIIVNCEKAPEGSRVNITLIPSLNFVIGAEPAVIGPGGNVPVSGLGSFWTFQMPGGEVLITAAFVQGELETRIIENFAEINAQVGGHVSTDNEATGFFATGTTWSGIVMASGAWGRKCIQLSATGWESFAGRKGPGFKPVDISGAVKIGVVAYAMPDTTEGDCNFVISLETVTDGETEYWSAPASFYENELGVARWKSFLIPLSEFENEAGAKLHQQVDNLVVTGYRFAIYQHCSIWFSNIDAYGQSFQ